MKAQQKTMATTEMEPSVESETDGQGGGKQGESTQHPLTNKSDLATQVSVLCL